MPYRTLENVIDGVVITFTDASSAKTLERTLREQASELKQMAEALPDLVWSCQSDGSCNYVSPRWLEYTGVPSAEQLGYGWLELVHAAERDRVRETWRAAVKTGQRFDAYFLLRRASGKHRWFKARSIPIRDSAGAIVRWYGANAEVELGALLRRTLEDQRSSFEAQGVALDSRVDGEPVWVRADSARLIQIVSNLLGNALKFTPRGGRVALGLSCPNEVASVEVADTGVGIAPDMLPHVFEPFAQAPQTLDRARGGVGLGLAMVKGLVELHGGQVSLESLGAGSGTRVVVSLPRCAAPAQDGRDEEAAPPASRRPRRVLGDNLDTADTLQVALSLFGHEVRTAQDGAGGGAGGAVRPRRRDLRHRPTGHGWLRGGPSVPRASASAGHVSGGVQRLRSARRLATCAGRGLQSAPGQADQHRNVGELAGRGSPRPQLRASRSEPGRVGPGEHGSVQQDLTNLVGLLTLGARLFAKAPRALIDSMPAVPQSW